jgi:hypothetical protein
MAISWQKVPIPIVRGLDRSVDDKHLSPPALDICENGVFDKQGAIKKRNGYDAVGTTDNVADAPITTRGRNLTRREDELVLLHEDYLYSQDPVRNEWVRRGVFNSPILEAFSTAQRSADQTNCNQAQLNDVIVTAWEENQPHGGNPTDVGRLFYQVTNATTGTVYVGPREIVGFIKPIIIVGGSPATLRLYAIPTVSAGPSTLYIRMWSFNLTDPSTNLFARDTGGTDVIMDQVSTFGGRRYLYDVQASTQAGGTAYMLSLEVDHNDSFRDKWLRVRHLDTDGITTISGELNTVTFAGQGGPQPLMGTIVQDTQYGGNRVAQVWIQYDDPAFPIGDDQVVNVQLHAPVIDAASLTGVQTIAGWDVATGDGLLDPRAPSVVAAWDSATVARILWPEMVLDSGGAALTPRFFHTRQRTIDTGSNLGDETFFKGQAVPASRPFYDNANWYIWFAFKSALQSQLLCVRQDGFIAARALPGTYQGYPGAATTVLSTPPEPEMVQFAGKFLPTVQTLPGLRKSIMAVPYKRRLDTQQVTTLTGENRPLTTTGQRNPAFTQLGVRVVSLDFNTTSQGYRARELGDVSYANGGLLWQYDGTNVVESGFHIYPELFTGAVLPTASGDEILEGTYAYKVYFEWTNARGQRERSTVAGPITVDVDTPSAPARIALSIRPLQMTGKQDVSIVVYRTEMDPTFDAPFYRVSNVDPRKGEDSIADNFYVPNVPLPAFFPTFSDVIQFVDNMPDTVLIRQELDKSNSGVLDNVPPPAPTVIAEGKDRLFVASYEDDSLVRFSKLRNDEGPVEFNDALTIALEDSGGKITGLSIMNESLIIFKRTRIYVVTGQGPNNLGLGAFSLPQRVSSDVGCIDQRSIVQTPLGVMFQSERGLFLLDQRFQTEFFGSGVEDVPGIVTGTVLQESESRVIFLCSTGTTVVYDFRFDIWATFTDHLGRGIVRSRNLLYYLRTDGRNVYRENLTSFLEGNAGYQLNVRTGWYKLEGLQGFQRVRKLEAVGTFKTNHVLNIAVQYDYTPTETAYTYTADTAPTQVPYHFRLHLGRQKCDAIRFRFYDSPLSPAITSAQAYELNELALEVGIKRTLDKTSNLATGV